MNEENDNQLALNFSSQNPSQSEITGNGENGNGSNGESPAGFQDDGPSALRQMMASHFMEYASYVIKDRAIPHINDGLKPVQRRILHSLAEMDDGKFHKVANVVGNTMKYHPHGDALNRQRFSEFSQ